MGKPDPSQGEPRQPVRRPHVAASTATCWSQVPGSIIWLHLAPALLLRHSCLLPKAGKNQKPYGCRRMPKLNSSSHQDNVSAAKLGCPVSSKDGLQTSTTSIARELVRNAEPQGLPNCHWVRTKILIRRPMTMAFGEALKYMAISFGATFYPEIKARNEDRCQSTIFSCSVSLVLVPILDKCVSAGSSLTWSWVWVLHSTPSSPLLAQKPRLQINRETGHPKNAEISDITHYTPWLLSCYFPHNSLSRKELDKRSLFFSQLGKRCSWLERKSKNGGHLLL